MMRSAWAPVLLLTTALAGGCASLPARQDDTTAEEIRQLKARVLELQRKAAVSEVELARLRQQVTELETQLGVRRGEPAARRPAGATTAPAPAVTPSRPAVQSRPRAAAPVEDDDEEEIAEVPDEPQAVRPQRVPEFEESDLEIEEPAAPPARSPATSAPPTVRPTAPAPAAPPPAAEDVPGPASQALYDRGYALYHQGRFVDAETSFQRFLQGNPASELADNAQYWIGECRYARNDYRGALAAFREAVERYPDGNKVSDALLKAGQCLESLGDREGARVAYAEVSKRFPGTAAAAVAEERRGKLR